MPSASVGIGNEQRTVRGRELPRIVEFVGAPGTGKSTLVRMLLERKGASVRRASLRHWLTGFLLLKNLGLALRPFAFQFRSMGKRRWNRLSLMVQLRTLENLLGRLRTDGPDIVLLDQGPVYMLSILQRARSPEASTLEPDDPPDTVFEAYWRRTVAGWATRLDHVVVLEADDDVLHRRVRERAADHQLERMTGSRASDFFRRSRDSSEPIIAMLAAHDRAPDVLRLRTDQLSLEETVERVLEGLDRGNSGSGR